METVSSCLPVELALSQYQALEDAARIHQIEHQRRVAEARDRLRDPSALLDQLSDRAAVELLGELLTILADSADDKLGRERDLWRKEIDRLAEIEAERMEREGE